MIPHTISFRLTADEAKTLYYQARDQQLSSHRLARNMVIEGLSLSRIEEGLQILAQRLEEIQMSQTLSQREIELLKEGVSVLLAKGEGGSRNETREWFDERFGAR